MAYYRREAPNPQQLNVVLVGEVSRLRAQAEDLYQKAAKVSEQSQCAHEWKHWVDESFDGHRTDRSDEYTCTKCGYSTNR